MARPEGVEPPTTRFEAGYSIQLSYGRVSALATFAISSNPWSDYPARSSLTGRSPGKRSTGAFLRILSGRGRGLEPFLKFLRRLLTDLRCDGGGDRGDCRDQHAEIIGVTDDRRQIRDGVDQADEISQRGVDGGLGPRGRGRTARRVVKNQRLLDDIAPRGKRIGLERVPE